MIRTNFGGTTMKNVIEETFGLTVLQFFDYGQYKAFRTRRKICMIVPVSHIEEDELYEMYQMGQHLLENKERNVAMFLLTKQGTLSFYYEKEKFVLLQVPFYSGPSKVYSLGRSLAQFHQKGRTLAVKISKTNRIGKWKSLWEQRLDQLEVFWRGKVNIQPLNHFDKMFVESFPYYLGLCENAIQYLVDTEIDDEPQPVDAATICHHRFTSETWKSPGCKIPTEWVFDHAGRDLAEYIRDQFDKNNEVFDAAFLEDYDRTARLSSFFWRLVYSRLLFPLHYFECIENYYLSKEEYRDEYEKKLEKMLQESGKYERYISSFSSLLSMRTRKIYLPRIHWLSPS